MIKVYTLVRTPWFSWLDTQKEFQSGNVTEMFVPGDLKDMNYSIAHQNKPVFKTVFDSSYDKQNMEMRLLGEKSSRNLGSSC